MESIGHLKGWGEMRASGDSMNSRMRMEHMTMNEMIGSIDILKMSVRFSGGLFGAGNFSKARVAIKIAPTPTGHQKCVSNDIEKGMIYVLGPKWPLKTASLNVLMSGIHLYKARMTGRRRNRMTRIARTTSLQTFIVVCSL
jgi:hypothetical protein